MENKKIEVEKYGYKLTITSSNNKIIFNIRDENGLETEIEINQNKDNINPHEIGRTIESNYIKNNRINIEPYKLSRIIDSGLKQIELK